MHQESPRTVSIRPTLSHARLLFRQLLENVDPKIWLKWVNGAGDTLLKMADTRKKEKAL